MIYDFTITDLTPRPSNPSYFDSVLNQRVYAQPVYRIYDARGVRVLYLKYCDTETGKVIRYDVLDGTWQIDPVTNRVIEIRETRPAPLTVVPIRPGEPYLLPTDKIC